MSDERRRAPDPVVAKLVTDVESVKKELAKNTEVTEQVRDILASFRVIGAVAKWLTVIAALAGAILSTVKGVDIKVK